MCENLGPVVLAGLSSRFLQESVILIQKLSNPEVNKQQRVDVIKEVHKVTDSVAVLGAIEIHAKLQNVKIKGEYGLSENLWNAVDKLGPVWSRIKPSLKKVGKSSLDAKS